jgi:hypothetical protein
MEIDIVDNTDIPHAIWICVLDFTDSFAASVEKLYASFVPAQIR